MQEFDVMVVGGGPGGSSCAAALTRAGMRVAILDRARFPRVKLCAGWLSHPVWELLDESPDSYPHHLWAWKRCHVYYQGKRHTTRTRGYFIRRYEFDNWLLSRSGACVLEHNVKHLEHDGDNWIVDGKYQAAFLVGAGGTHCPVARQLFPSKSRVPVAAQELEFEASPSEIAATRVGEDGEPEILLLSDLSGYAWNVPKSRWLNLGCGTVNPKKVKQAWSEAREFFRAQHHIPSVANETLEHAKGHSYYLFDPSNLQVCEHSNAFVVGDALGLAQPLSAEGILPAILSGQLCAEAIIDRRGESYRERLKTHPVFSDYDFLYRARETGAGWRTRLGSAGSTFPTPTALGALGDMVIASGFAWMFSGQPIPGRPLRRLLRNH